MRVVLALHQFPPYGNGGTEQLVAWTARALSQAGHAVRIVAAIPRRSSASAQSRDPLDSDLDVAFLEPSTDETTIASIAMEALFMGLTEPDPDGPRRG